MSTALRTFLSVPLTSFLAAALVAQVPDGYVAFGTFGSGTTQGIYFAHPRDTTALPIEVIGLPQDLASTGSGSRGVASLLRRASDGALLAGERAPSGASVDLHVLQLVGRRVVAAQSFACGISGGVGEIPQFGLLPDGRVVVAATGLLPGGELSHFTNGSYGWQGLAVLDTGSGQWTPVPVAGWRDFVGVMNGMAVSRDGSTVWLGAYISTSAGALWQIPVAGGAAVHVADLPFGDSNITVDQDGSVVLTTLNGPPNLFRFDPLSRQLVSLPSQFGPLNAITVEPATGNFVIATANAGSPNRSLVLRRPDGFESALLSPNLGTISSVAVNPDPEVYGVGSPGADYRWQVEPNPGGLPEAGNSGFSLTIAGGQGALAYGALMFGWQRIAPLHAFGVDVLVDPAGAVFATGLLADTLTIPLPLPATPTLVGAELFAQSFWVQGDGSLAASAGVSLTVL